MKIKFSVVILLFFLTGCGVINFDKKPVCDCCEKSFTNLDSATNCLVKTPDTTTSADFRCFLFVFVSKDIKRHQETGWNIFTDKEVIDAAKKDYLLIIQDVSKFKLPKRLDGSLILEKIKDRKSEPYFMITNQALYPFSEWTLAEKKDIVLVHLRTGIGP